MHNTLPERYLNLSLKMPKMVPERYLNLSLSRLRGGLKKKNGKFGPLAETFLTPPPLKLGPLSVSHSVF